MFLKGYSLLWSRDLAGHISSTHRKQKDNRKWVRLKPSKLVPSDVLSLERLYLLKVPQTVPPNEDQVFRGKVHEGNFSFRLIVSAPCSHKFMTIL